LRVWVLALALAGCGTSAEKSDWEREHEEKLAPADEPVVLPAYPRGELLEFSTGPTSEFRFFVDPASISVGSGVVRYTLVARSPTGATNVSFEAMRCRSGEVRIYAVGRDGGWAGRATEWRATRMPWQNVLYRDYFCPLRQAIASRDEGIRALQR